MITAAMIGYYVLAIGLVVLVGYLTGLQNNREMRAAADAAAARMEAEFGRTPPVEPYVREPLPDFDPPEPELRITIPRHPGSDDWLAKTAARLIEEASRLELSLGGDGLRYDEAGSSDEPTKLVLRLVPNRVDWEAPHRLEEVAGELHRRMQLALQAAVQQQRADDIRRRIEWELHPPLPPEMVRDVEVAVGPVTTGRAAAEPSAAATA